MAVTSNRNSPDALGEDLEAPIFDFDVRDGHGE